MPYIFLKIASKRTPSGAIMHVRIAGSVESKTVLRRTPTDDIASDSPRLGFEFRGKRRLSYRMCYLC